MSAALQLANTFREPPLATEPEANTDKASAPSVDLEALVAAIDAHIKARPALRLAVMDVQRYDECLVILANGLMSPAFIRLALEPHWTGPIEVYDAASMFGAAVND